jgi:cation transporter-like permease
MMQCKNIGVTSGLLPPHNPMSKPITTLSTFIQVMLAFLIAGFGNVGAGLILDYVKEWPVFLHVDELFILVPSLLGLKGNLEMTMASRLSTQANLGHMDNTHKLIEMAKGNLALVQCQATVVSLSVAIFASTIKSMTFQTGSVGAGPDPVEQSAFAGNLLDGFGGSGSAAGPMIFKNTSSDLHNATGRLDSIINDSSLSQAYDGSNAANGGGGGPLVERQMNGFDWDNALILCASSLLTANIACFVLGTMMILVIVGSHKVRIDPDNIASPVAASLGDMTTAALLAVIAHSIYQYSENQRLPYLALIITLLFVGMLPVWISVAKNNSYTSDVITKGWTPIVIAVFISSCGGFILEHGKSRFSRLPVFQPVINGVGGNLVAVQASRLSTSLHRNGKPGELPNNFQLFQSPMELFVSKRNDINVTTARLLLLMSIPAHLLYFFVIRSIEGDNTAPVTAIFLGFYMAFAVLQVAVLLYLAQNLVNALWTCSIDPDNYSIPILTATGDLLGCAFLFIVFVVAFQFSDPYVMTTV